MSILMDGLEMEVLFSVSALISIEGTGAWSTLAAFRCVHKLDSWIGGIVILGLTSGLSLFYSRLACLVSIKSNELQRSFPRPLNKSGPSQVVAAGHIRPYCVSVVR